MALRVLLCVPAAYRSPHVFVHILSALGVPYAEMCQRVAAVAPGGTTAADAQAAAMTPDSLMEWRHPAPDTAMATVFAGVPRLAERLAHADSVIGAPIRVPLAPAASTATAAGGDEEPVPEAPFPVLPYDAAHPPQEADIQALRDAFDPIQRYVEGRVQMRIGSRHIVFRRHIDVLAALDEEDITAEDEESLVVEVVEPLP
jgi:hypothetical protein